MKSQEMRLSFKRPYEHLDAYGDTIYTYINQDPILIWLTTKDVVKFSDIEIQGQTYSYVGITKDQRPRKNDLIDEKKVVHKIVVNKFVYLFLEDLEGSDDYAEN